MFPRVEYVSWVSPYLLVSSNLPMFALFMPVYLTLSIRAFSIHSLQSDICIKCSVFHCPTLTTVSVSCDMSVCIPVKWRTSIAISLLNQIESGVNKMIICRCCRSRGYESSSNWSGKKSTATQCRPRTAGNKCLIKPARWKKIGGNNHSEGQLSMQIVPFALHIKCCAVNWPVLRRRFHDSWNSIEMW